MKLLQSFKTNFLVSFALLKRDIKIIVSNIKNTIIDSLILGFFFSLLYGYFFPALGMSLQFSAPLFLGIVVNLLISVSYSKCVGVKSDIDFKRFFDYHLTLMISKYWLIAEYIIAYTIDLIVSTIPAFLIGLTILNHLSKFNINFPLLLLMYTLSSLFLSVMFLFFAFGVKWNWFINNTWERILNPLIHFGGVFFIWHRLEQTWPLMAQISRFSPMTYMTDGLRYASLGSGNYIPIHISITVLSIGSIILLIPLVFAMKRHLDPV
ncbi:MAG: ABC transporter permease [Candidatus Babeliales bacterium]|nr:ABC transporter permease [Candidatus Babeliales bacterium]